MFFLRALMCSRAPAEDSPEPSRQEHEPLGCILICGRGEVVPVFAGRPFLLCGYEFTSTFSHQCLRIATVTRQSDDAKAKAKALEAAFTQRQEYLKLQEVAKQQAENLLTESCERITPEADKMITARRKHFYAARERSVPYARTTVTTHHELDLPPNQAVENELFSGAVTWVPRTEPVHIVARTYSRQVKEKVAKDLLWAGFARTIVTMRDKCTSITCCRSETFVARGNSVSSITKFGSPQSIELHPNTQITCLQSRGKSLLALDAERPRGVVVLPHNKRPVFVPLPFCATLMATDGECTVFAGDRSLLHVYDHSLTAALLIFDFDDAHTAVDISMNADFVFMLSGQGVVFIFSRCDGKRFDHFPASFRGLEALGGICVDNDSVFVACANTVQQYTMQGKLLMTYTSEFSDFFTALSCEDNRVYALDKANRVHIIE